MFSTRNDSTTNSGNSSEPPGNRDYASISSSSSNSGNVAATQSLSEINGLRPYLEFSITPSDKCSTISLNELMKEDVRIRNEYIVLQLLKIVSGSSSTTNNG